MMALSCFIFNLLASLNFALIPTHFNGHRILHRHLGPNRHLNHIYKIFGSTLGSTDSINLNYHDQTNKNLGNSTGGEPVIWVTDYGADPSGKTDSTAALKQAITAALQMGAPNANLSNGIHDCGGATIHLGGGDYMISAPLLIPENYGNLRIIDGTIRAANNFSPLDAYLLTIGGTNCNNQQHSCNENVGVENIMFDSRNINYGNLQIINTSFVENLSTKCRVSLCI